MLLTVEKLQDAYITKDDDIMFGISLLHAILLPVALCFCCKEFNTKNVLNVLFCVKKSKKQRSKRSKFVRYYGYLAGHKKCEFKHFVHQVANA